MRFYLFLAVFALLIFILNINHLNQQSIFDNLYVPIAENISEQGTYSLDSAELLYPLWGYPALLSIFDALGATPQLILLFQFVLAIISIHFFYKAFKISRKYWHILLFLPFFALMSVKWPDAVVGFLLMGYLNYIVSYFKGGKLISLVAAGIFFGIMVNFRSEYFFLPLLMVLFALIGIKSEYFKKLIISAFVTAVSAVIFIIPWAVHSYSIDGKIRYGASNGGAVFYISIGQLPMNPWGIEAADKSAYDFVQSKSIENPFSAQGDSILMAHSIALIKEKPGAYILKSTYNFAKAITGGLYSGEYANLVLSDSTRQITDKKLSSSSGMMQKIDTVFDSGLSVWLPLLAEKAIRLLTMPLLALMLLTFVLLAVRKKKYLPDRSISGELLAVSVIIIYKLLIVSAVQYEPRHMNAVYLPLLGTMLISMPALKQKLFSKFNKNK